jgi:hypothetical protein
VSYQVLSAKAWASREFGAVELKDKRLTKRVVQIAAGMAADPQGSIPKQNKAPHQSKAAYRLFDHERAIMDSLCNPHWQQTRLGCSHCPVVLLIQDTTWLDYSAHPQTQGTGWCNYHRKKNKTTGSGLFLHSVLAVEPQGQGMARVIGLAWATLYARNGEPLRGNQQKRSQRRKSSDRESMRWIEAVQQIGKSPPLSRFIHVGDRESDIYELYEQTQTHSVGFVIRLKHDRNASVGHDTPDTCGSEDRKGSSIKEICRQMKVSASQQLWISPRAGRAGRWAKLSISSAAVTLWSPQINRTGRALRCWALRAWEENPPADVKEPVEWMLLTSEPVNSGEDALRIVDYYGCRWLIEEYHQCLKSGCKVEQRQLEDATRLEPLIGMLTIVAVRLLQMKNDVRLTPEKPAIECVPPELVQTLAKLIKEKNPERMTVRRFTHEVAKRGGFMGRKGDGEPGWRTLWHGWQELSLIHAGYEMAKEGMRYGE